MENWNISLNSDHLADKWLFMMNLLWWKIAIAFRERQRVTAAAEQSWKLITSRSTCKNMPSYENMVKCLTFLYTDGVSSGYTPFCISNDNPIDWSKSLVFATSIWWLWMFEATVEYKEASEDVSFPWQFMYWVSGWAGQLIVPIRIIVARKLPHLTIHQTWKTEICWGSNMKVYSAHIPQLINAQECKSIFSNDRESLTTFPTSWSRVTYCRDWFSGDFSPVFSRVIAS